MDIYSTGLSLVLGRVLTAWCEQLKPLSMKRYEEIGGFQALKRTASMTHLDLLAELRAGGLRDRGFMAEPLYLNWQRFQRRHEPGVLVVDATQHDSRSQSSAFLIQNNPFGLVEALLIAARACNTDRCLLLLPPALQDLQAVILNTLETVLSHDLARPINLRIELVRDAEPSIWTHGPDFDTEKSALVHHLETWYHLTLMLSLGASRYKTLGLEGQAGTCLLTVGGPLERPGLVEVPLGGDLWHAVESLSGGLKQDVKPLALALDDGMGGFLPPSAANIPLSPEEMAAAWVTPTPMTLWLMEEGDCLVEATRKTLYRYWLLSEDQDPSIRTLIAKAARMVTEITVGKGLESHLSDLDMLGQEMAAKGLTTAWPLLSSLKYFRDQWDGHIRQKECPQGACLKRRVAPCHSTCPAGIDIPSFLALVGHKKYSESSGVIALDNPLHYVCGLVCPAPCENVCLRGEMDAPIHIRAMKAVSAKHALAQGGYPEIQTAASTGKKVAIVGSGPAGLTAAYFLAKNGHKVEIFEAQKEAGGMLRYGIPAYRLPREVLDQEVAQITKLGVAIHTDKEIGHLDELRSQSFDAIFLALGTQISRMIPIEGKELPFVLGGLDFLKQVRGDEDPRVGPRVVVVGGGNVAIDVALSALRQGGRRVDMVCLEKRREMPAHPHEVQMALDEGVAIHNSWGPVSISPDHQFVAMRCTRVFDERGRFSPQFDPETRMTLEADHLILAIGQATDLACVEVGSLVEVTRGLICTDETTLETREPGVFAGGDVVHGPRTVVEAIRAGKQAAASIEAYLRGAAMDPSWSTPRRKEDVEPLHVNALSRTNLRRPEIPVRDIEDRKGNFLHIELGLTDEMAVEEASRCLRCDLCIGCGLCQLVCSEVGAEALRLRETKANRLAFNDFTRPSNRCIGCGSCARVCPTGAIRINDENGMRQTVITGTVVREQKLLPCSRCGEPFMSQAYLDHMKNRVGPEAFDHLDRLLCASCAREKRTLELAPFASIVM